MNIQTPPELQTMLDAHAGRHFANDATAKKTRGLIVGRLNLYAGGDARRKSFLKALFGTESSKDLADDVVLALRGWIDHPNVANDVNRIISQYFVEMGQTELPFETPPQRVGTPSTVGKVYETEDVIVDFVATQNPGRLKKGGDYCIPFDVVAASNEVAMEMNARYPDALLFVSVAVITDPRKRSDVLRDIGGLANGDAPLDATP